MSFSCVQGHSHGSDHERLDCDARYFDAMSLIKMAQVNFQGPKKLPRIHAPGRPGKLGDLDVTVFSEEEIVPWQLEGDQLDTDPGLLVPGLGGDDDEEIAPDEDEELPAREDDDEEEVTDPRGLPTRKR